MKRLLRNLLLLIVLLSGVSAAGLEFLNQRVLPEQVRRWATEASHTLGRRITISRLRFHLWRGVVLEQVAIGEDARYGKTDFVKIDEVSGRVLLIPLIKDRRFVVPRLTIVRPYVRFVQDSGGIFNIQSLPAKKSEVPQPSRTPLGVLIPNIVIRDGHAEIVSHRPEKGLSLSLEHLDAQIGWSLPDSLRWTLTTQVNTQPRITVETEGSWRVSDGQLSLTAFAKIPLTATPAFLPETWKASIPSMEGMAKVEASLSGSVQGPLALRGLAQVENLRCDLRSPFPPARMGTDPLLKASGRLALSVEGPIPLHRTPDFGKDLKGTLDLDAITVSPLPIVGELNQIQGRIRFDSGGLKTESMKALLPTGEELKVVAGLINDKQKTANFQINTNLSVAQLPRYVPELALLLPEPALEGESRIEIAGVGHLRPHVSLTPRVTAFLTETSMGLKGQMLLKNVSGTVRWQPDLLTASGLQGQFRDQAFQLEGTVVDFAQPEIDARLAWGALACEIRVAQEEDRLQIDELSGRLGQGTFRIFGEIDGFSLKGASEPIAHLYGETAFDVKEWLSHLSNLLTWADTPNWTKAMGWARDLPFTGNLSARWFLKGKLLAPKEWELTLRGNSNRLVFREVPVEQLRFELSQRGTSWEIPWAKAQFAQGALTASGLFRPADPQNAFRGKLTLEGAELSRLSETFRWKTKDLAGQLFLDGELAAQGMDLKTVQGKGSLQIRGARILELPLLGPLADLLNLSTLRTIVFQEAEGPFVIREGAIYTDSLLLKSPQATLTILGSGGFLQGGDSPIALRVLPTLTPELIPEESRTKVGKVIAKGVSYFVGEIQLTGTWRNVKRKFISKPLTQILNEQIFNLQDVLREVF